MGALRATSEEEVGADAAVDSGQKVSLETLKVWYAKNQKFPVV